jgi:hypothetical protein
METRKAHQTKFSALPIDYVKMVNGVFSTNFDESVKTLTKKTKTKTFFETSGRIYPDEVILSVSLMQEGQMAATTVHGSIDFDPKASAPTIQDVLGALVDAVGSLFEQLLDFSKPEKIDQLLDQSLSAMENVPFEWTQVQLDRHKIFLKIDKSNPMLDRMTDDWLDKNDPHRKDEKNEEEAESEKLFVTGPSSKTKH